MTWKWAAVDLFHGGAKAGILGDPGAPDKEGVLRAFARALRNEVPAEYVFGLDMGLSEQDAAVLQFPVASGGGFPMPSPVDDEPPSSTSGETAARYAMVDAPRCRVGRRTARRP